MGSCLAGIGLQSCEMKKLWRSLMQHCEILNTIATLKMVQMVNFVICFIFLLYHNLESPRQVREAGSGKGNTRVWKANASEEVLEWRRPDPPQERSSLSLCVFSLCPFFLLSCLSAEPFIRLDKTEGRQIAVRSRVLFPEAKGALLPRWPSRHLTLGLRVLGSSSTVTASGPRLMHGGRINSLINMLGQSQAFVYAELHFGLRSSAKRREKKKM